MFRPMAGTVILALLCLTWIPAFASVVIRREVREGDTWLVRRIRGRYRPALAWCEGHPWIVAGEALFAGSVMVARRPGGELILGRNEYPDLERRSQSVVLPGCVPRYEQEPVLGFGSTARSTS